MEYLLFFSLFMVALSIFATAAGLFERTKLYNKLTELLLNEKE